LLTHASGASGSSPCPSVSRSWSLTEPLLDPIAARRAAEEERKERDRDAVRTYLTEEAGRPIVPNRVAVEIFRRNAEFPRETGRTFVSIADECTSKFAEAA
jgi:hypothetical protein